VSLTDDLGGSSEVVLLERARTGDGSSFGVLYERHLGAARRVARSLVADRSDADDVVAEVFAATFTAMRRGLGPAEDFRTYVLRSVRRECQRTWRRGDRQRPGGEVVVDLAAARSSGRDDFGWFDEGEVVHRAFAALSPRLQHVLWLTEIEGLSHDDIASRLGTTCVNVAQLARRARVEFGEHYLEAHLPATDGPVPAACVRPRRVLAEVVRGTASRRAERMAAEHMATCPACAGADAELRVVNARLRTGHVMVLLPALNLSRPVTTGVLAKLMAWITGPLPTMSAAASLAVATAVAPQPSQPYADAATVTAPAAVVEPDRTVVASSPGPTAVVDRGALPDAGAAPSVGVETGVEIDPVPADPGRALPGVVGAVSGVATAAVDDQVVDAVASVLEAVPAVSLQAGIGSVVPVGPVTAPPVQLDVTLAGGDVGADAVAGDAAVEVAAGPSNGAAVDVVVPPLGDVLDVVPMPELPSVPSLPPG